MLINTENKQLIPEYFLINGSNINLSKQVKNLGLTFDQTLYFEIHVDNICSRATYAATRQISFTRVALSHLNYCTIWNFFSKNTLMKAEKYQNN